MALPFLAGLAVGSLAVVAFNNKKEIKEAAQKGFEKTKECATDIKESAQEKLETIVCKKEKEKPIEESV